MCGRDYHGRVSAPTARPRADFQSRWLPAIAWACAMFAFSGIPSLGTGLGTWDLVLRKLAHATEYAVLVVLLTRAVASAPAFALALAFALSDELHQRFVPGRAAKPLDVAIDATGALIGLLVARRLRSDRLASPRWSRRISRTGSSKRSSPGSTRSRPSSRG
jgi:VanZ like protein